jgi:hypothetical protein
MYWVARQNKLEIPNDKEEGNKTERPSLDVPLNKKNERKKNGFKTSAFEYQNPPPKMCPPFLL